MTLLARQTRTLALVGAAALALTACSGSPDAPQEPAAIEVLVLKVEPGAVDGSVANSDTVSKIGLMYCQGQLR
jgi:multidrug efflux pump subunit AcrA (membrane-fusion protein)